MNRRIEVLLSTLVITGVLGACNSGAPTKATLPKATPPVATTPKATPPVATTPEATPPVAISSTVPGPVLPVQDNPINNSATANTLHIESVLVENNVDSSGKAVSDHLEIVLKNTGQKPLTGFEVFYTFADPTTGTTESYYANLSTSFTIPAAGKRVAHFDASGDLDHFAINKFSLFYTNTNALNVSVTVSAKDAAVQKFELKKDAGGAEAAD